MDRDLPAFHSIVYWWCHGPGWATERVCACGKWCPELLKRSGGGQRTSSPVEFCAVPRPGSVAWRSRHGCELRPHIYLWEQRAAAIDQLWKRRRYGPAQHQTICDGKTSDTQEQQTQDREPNEFKPHSKQTRFKRLYKQMRCLKCTQPFKINDPVLRACLLVQNLISLSRWRSLKINFSHHCAS